MNEPTNNSSHDAEHGDHPSELPLHHKHHSHREVSRHGQLQNISVLFYILAALLLLAVATGSFVAGYGLGHVSNGTTTAGRPGSMNGAGGGGFGARQRGGFGTVTSVSTSSITITDDNFRGTSDTSKTYSITSSTTVTNDGSSASISDIKTGDTVRVTTSSSTSTDATAIEINPSFGGAGAQTQDDSGTGNTDTGSST